LQSYKKALAIRESAAAANPENLAIQAALLNDYFRLSFTLNDAGDQTGALENIDKAIPLAQRIVAAHPDPQNQDWLAGFYWENGNILLRLGRNDDALASYRRGVAIREPIASGLNANPLLRTHLAADYVGLGKAMSASGDVAHALDPLKQGADLLQQLSRMDPTNATLMEYLAESNSVLAETLKRHGDYEQALEYFSKARDRYQELSRANPTDSLSRVNVISVDIGVGNVLMAEGKTTAGIRLLRSVNSTLERVEHKNRYELAALAETDSTLGQGYLSLAEQDKTVNDRVEQLREARSWYQKSLVLRREAASSGSADVWDDGETIASLSRQVAKCDAALSKLSYLGPSSASASIGPS